MIALKPLTRLREINNAEISLREWRRQVLDLQEEFGRENNFVQAKIKALLAELERLYPEFGD
jgi:hypothetical protein